MRLGAALPCECSKPGKLAWFSAVALLLVAAGLWLGWLLYAPAWVPAWFWAAFTACFLFSAFLVMWRIKCSPWGLILNDRNMASLGKFQVTVWTLLVLATSLAALLLLIHLDEPPDVAGDDEGLVQLGSVLGATTLSAAALGQKRRVQPSVKEIKERASVLAPRYASGYLHDLTVDLDARRPAESGADAPTSDAPEIAWGMLLDGDHYGQADEVREHELADGVHGIAAIDHVRHMLEASDRRLVPVALARFLNGDVAPRRALKKSRRMMEAEIQDLVHQLETAVRDGVLDVDLLRRDVLAGLEAWVRHDLVERGSGALYANDRPCEASILDMVYGDQLGNTVRLDFGKIQFLLATVIALGAYCIAAWQGFVAGQPEPLETGLPLLGAQLTGLSATGYVASKLASGP